MGDNSNYYKYDPSKAAAVIFFILFLGTTSLHTYQLMRTRTWIVIPLNIGGFCKIHALSLDRLADCRV